MDNIDPELLAKAIIIANSTTETVPDEHKYEGSNYESAAYVGEGNYINFYSRSKKRPIYRNLKGERVYVERKNE